MGIEQKHQKNSGKCILNIDYSASIWSRINWSFYLRLISFLKRLKRNVYLIHKIIYSNFTRCDSHVVVRTILFPITLDSKKGPFSFILYIMFYEMVSQSSCMSVKLQIYLEHLKKIICSFTVEMLPTRPKKGFHYFFLFRLIDFTAYW